MYPKILSLCTLFLLITMTHAAETRRYTILVDNGVKAGEQVVEIDDKGATKVRFIFKDNGRGPELNETISLKDDGTVANYSAKGNSTFGSVINEQFSQQGDQATWSAGAKTGSAKVAGSALYMPIEGSAEILSIAINAIAKSGNNSIALLPSGTLTQEVVSDLIVEKGGEKQKVQLLVQTGMGLEPRFVWATNGDDPHLFALLIPGYLTLIDDGWQANAQKMNAIQQEAETALLQARAKDLPVKLDGLTVVRNARIFDSASTTVTAPSDVFFLRGKITAIVPAGSLTTPVDNFIDAQGRIMLPGLFDMHGHISRWEGGLHLAAGVTSLRDMGNDNATLQLMLDEIDQNKLLAPTIFPTGFLEGESEMSARSGFVVSDLAGAKAAINWYVTHGYHQLKIYNSFPKEILKDTVSYAHSRGMRVSGHVPAFLKAEDAIEAGFDEIQHINQLVLNFLVKPETDTRTLERFYLPAREFADFDLQGKKIQNFISLLKNKGLSIDPTLATFDFLKKVDGTVGDPWKDIVGHLPPDLQRQYHTAEVDIPDAATAALYAKSYAKMLEFTGLMYKAGIPIVAGTDELAGFTLQGELELLVKAGLTPAQALQVATLNGAQFSNATERKGQITVGRDADLLLVDGDPTKNISDIRKLALVITQGKAIYPTKIYQAMGIEPFVSELPEIMQNNAATGAASGGSVKTGQRHLH
ncbi:amidohydrolase family protein [Paraglaciecola hydrolytica]|uniref:Amidohydrolase n=1 Tax=Paraglaciecola hydrolytica TaxID=1799789 RepID=A0A136A4T7_9ALTE|nr:amidohydrolase family protein [Paraglaciecola hydrolytica]KXI30231.1 amidohydrolase [Paraglaciecola hydrolytica]